MGKPSLPPFSDQNHLPQNEPHHTLPSQLTPPITAQQQQSSNIQPHVRERTNVGNYDMKARVVAEKLKGKKDLEVIEWAKTHLNFHIQYRRNIYRWKKNPIILKLAKQYAGLIENAEVPDRIKNSYRVLNSKGEDVYDCFVEYVNLALEYEIPIDESFVEHKFVQLCEFNGMSVDEIANFSTHAIERIKKLYAYHFQNIAKKPLSNYPNYDHHHHHHHKNLLKSASKQIFIEKLKDLKSFITINNWKDVYCLREAVLRYSLVDETKASKYDILIHPKNNNSTMDNNNYKLNQSNQILSFATMDEDEKDGDPTNKNLFDQNKSINNNPLSKNQIIMVYFSSLDGLSKGNVSFIGQVPNPRKFANLSKACNYYHTTTGWITKSFFQAYLQVISENIKRLRNENDNSNSTVFLICDQSQFHNVSDDLIPDNIKLIMLNRSVYHQFRNDNKISKLAGKMYFSKVLKSLSKTLNNFEYFYPIDSSYHGYNNNNNNNKILKLILKSLTLPIADSINIICDIWKSFPPEMISSRSELLINMDIKDLDNNGEEGNDDHYEEQEEENDDMYESDNYDNEDKTTNIYENNNNIATNIEPDNNNNNNNKKKKRKHHQFSSLIDEKIRIVDNQFQDILKKLNKNSYIKKSPFGKIENILLTTPEINPAISLELETLKNSPIDEDFIYQQILKKLETETSASSPPQLVKPVTVSNMIQVQNQQQQQQQQNKENDTPEIAHSISPTSLSKNRIDISSMLNDQQSEPQPQYDNSRKRPVSIDSLLNSCGLMESKKPRIDEMTAITTATTTTNDSYSIPISDLINNNQNTISNQLVSKLGTTINDFSNNDSMESTQNDAIREFEKAVYNLHVQFVMKPYGPFKNIELFKQMTFDQIYNLTFADGDKK